LKSGRQLSEFAGLVDMNFAKLAHTGHGGVAERIFYCAFSGIYKYFKERSETMP